MLPPLPRILSAKNDIVVDETGHRLIDLFSANGTTWLGHCNAAVNDAVKQQLDQVWITGGLGSSVLDQAKTAIESFFPSSHRVVALYSTGMEASEFAMRLARGHTGRSQIAGFEHSMHGKSAATSLLGWDNSGTPGIPWLHRLPFVTGEAEDLLLKRLENLLAKHPVAAVFVEPMQGSAGMHRASTGFYESLMQIANAAEVIVVFDEMLSGFHRTGVPFVFSELKGMPDVILAGKAMGNGFPVSAVVANRQIEVTSAMLPGSTFAGNPLAAAAVCATLQEFGRLDLPANVRAIERIIVEQLRTLPKEIILRGRGAMWCVELPPAIKPQTAAEDCYKRGVLTSYAGNFIRILPAVTIELDNLRQACGILRDALLKAVHEHH